MEVNLSKRNDRMSYLDGIRGLMAINVVLNHFIVVFFPDIIYFDNGENIFNSSPIQALYNGSTAVSYFFILSGFLTSYFILKKRELTIRTVVTKTVKRYLRLLPVIALTVFVTYVFMEFGLLYHLKIDRELLTLYCNFSPNFLGALKDIFIDTFLTSSKYVGPFWFVRFDFLGYIITLLTLYALLKFDKLYKFRRIFMIICVFVYSYISVQLTAFAFGIFLADIYIGDQTLLSKYYDLKNKIILIFCGVIGLFLVCTPISITGPWRFLNSISLFPHTRFWCALGCLLCLWVLLNCISLKKILSNKILLFLGKISFPIYAVHWVCMLSLQDFLFYQFSKTISYTASALLSFAITVPVIILSAYIVWYLLEKNKPIEKISELFNRNKNKK